MNVLAVTMGHCCRWGLKKSDNLKLVKETFLVLAWGMHLLKGIPPQKKTQHILGASRSVYWQGSSFQGLQSSGRSWQCNSPCQSVYSASLALYLCSVYSSCLGWTCLLGKVIFIRDSHAAGSAGGCFFWLAHVMYTDSWRFYSTASFSRMPLKKCTFLSCLWTYQRQLVGHRVLDGSRGLIQLGLSCVLLLWGQ